jgi:HlyD family secretion protein
LEALLARHSTGGGTVYLVTLGIVLSAAAWVLVASVDVTVRAPGTLRPIPERQTVRTLVDGVVARVAVTRGQAVGAGDTLLVLGSTATDRARDAANSALREQLALARDLRLMLAGSVGAPHDAAALSLPRSRAAVREAAVEWQQLSIGVQRIEGTWDRLRQLALRGFAAPAELETAELELAQAREGRTLALERRRGAWSVELAGAEQRAAELRRDVSRESSAHAAHALVAPVAGTIEELSAVTPGSTVRAGDPVATVSPATSLVADVLVPPRDVGWIRTGMPVRLIVEGYDVQEWGAAEGIVSAVATDYTIANDQPVFRVSVRPLRTYLRRPDGRTVALRKGLRCQARFLVGRRRLTRLLLHRAREWADPSEPTTSADR